MLKEISVDQINEIADLSNEARDAQGRLLDKTQIVDQFDDAQLVQEEIGTFETLDASLNNEPLTRLKQTVDALAPAARRELIAVMLIGRGDFAAGEWDKALSQAENTSNDSDTARLTEKVLLHDYLKKGLYLLRPA
ncbi:DUF3775 domain-containing protein [Rhodospirillaceae bacterium SYSU D60014]|uniref:DUF3775 domain-containing protein n=1 Tax=Virgifigura deserti TaxID=2268457 RepID=UPI0013C5232D